MLYPWYSPRICLIFWMIAMDVLPRWWSPRSPLKPGTSVSRTLHWQMPYWIDWSTMLTVSNYLAILNEGCVLLTSIRPVDLYLTYQSFLTPHWPQSTGIGGRIHRNAQAGLKLVLTAVLSTLHDPRRDLANDPV